jgi:ATP-dependent DNA ligase
LLEPKGLVLKSLRRKTLASILMKASPIERKYIVRLALDEIRLGIADKTLLDAIAVAFLGSKKKRATPEYAYNFYPYIGYVAKTVAKRAPKRKPQGHSLILCQSAREANPNTTEQKSNG